MTSSMELCSLLRIDPAIPSEWGCADGRVARARMRATQGRRRKDHMVAGVTPATRFCGGGRRHTAAARTRARGGERRARGGSRAHPERVGGDEDA